MKSPESFKDKVDNLTKKEIEISKLEEVFFSSKSLVTLFYEIFFKKVLGYELPPINMNFVDDFEVGYEMTIADHQISDMGESIITIYGAALEKYFSLLTEEQRQIYIYSVVGHEFAHLVQFILSDTRLGEIYSQQILLANFGIDTSEDRYIYNASIEDQAFYFEGIFLRWLNDNGHISLNKDKFEKYMDALETQSEYNVANNNLGKNYNEYGRTNEGHPDFKKRRELWTKGYCSSISEEVKLLFGVI